MLYAHPTCTHRLYAVYTGMSTLKLTTSTITVKAVMPAIRKDSLVPLLPDCASVKSGSAEMKVDSTSALKIQPQNTSGW